MRTPSRTSPARTLRAIAATALAALACAPAAGAYVTDQEAQASADAAVAWFATKQNAANGQIAGFGGDWAVIGLAAVGVNAADLREGQIAPAAAGPSLQDYFHDAWVASGPGDMAIDQARGILVGEAGGIQTAHLSVERNLVARLASFFDGSQLGSPSLINDDIFGLLALEHAGPADAIAPTLASGLRAAQTTKAPGEAGWNFGGNPAGNPDVDMTGAGIAGLCAAGADASDPAVAAAVEWLQTKQDPVSGGIRSSFFGANSDSTSWVVNGLRQCGIDPQGPEWTTDDGLTPLDFLISLQKDNGAFVWQPPATGADNVYSTQGAVNALVGDGFGHAPAARVDPSLPRLRPAPVVAGGTPVPLTLVLDHGDAIPGAERICAVTAAVGATVADVLEAAVEASEPAARVEQLDLRGDGPNQRLATLNGVAAEPGSSRWEASVDGGPAGPALSGTVGLGATVALSLVGDVADQPSAPLPALPAVAGSPAGSVTRAVSRRAVPRALLRRGARLRLVRDGRLRLAVGCPRGTGTIGCRGVLRVRYRFHSGGRLIWRTAGAAAFVVGAGERTAVTMRLGPRLRRLAARGGKGRAVRLVAIVRDGTGTLRVTRTAARVRR